MGRTMTAGTVLVSQVLDCNGGVLHSNVFETFHRYARRKSLPSTCRLIGSTCDTCILTRTVESARRGMIRRCKIRSEGPKVWRKKKVAWHKPWIHPYTTIPRELSKSVFPSLAEVRVVVVDQNRGLRRPEDECRILSVNEACEKVEGTQTPTELPNASSNVGIAPSNVCSTCHEKLARSNATLVPSTCRSFLRCIACPTSFGRPQVNQDTDAPLLDQLHNPPSPQSPDMERGCRCTIRVHLVDGRGPVLGLVRFSSICFGGIPPRMDVECDGRRGHGSKR